MEDNPFKVLGEQKFGSPVAPAIEEGEVKQRIDRLLKDNPVILFMKGTPQGPQCGFSATSCAVLNAYETNYASYDILQDSELRQSLKEVSGWPTFPQLYVNGDLVGGNDILMELHQTGELADVLK